MGPYFVRQLIPPLVYHFNHSLEYISVSTKARLFSCNVYQNLLGAELRGGFN